MVTTFFSIPHDDLKLAASIRPVSSVAIKAQEEAIKAQEIATEAQHEALTAQTAELSAETHKLAPAQCVVDKFMEEACAADLRLEKASKAVREADEKLIEHAKK